MTILELIQKLSDDLKAVRAKAPELSEGEIQDAFTALSEILGQIAAMLGEEQSALMVATLEQELEADFEKALSEVDLLLDETKDAVTHPELLATFLLEAKGLQGYNKETDLVKIFARTVGYLVEVRSANPTTDFIRMFVAVASTMVDRRQGIAGLIRAYQGDEKLTDDHKTLLRGLVQYAKVKSNKSAMRNLGESIAKAE